MYKGVIKYYCNTSWAIKNKNLKEREKEKNIFIISLPSFILKIYYFKNILL